MRRLVGLGLLTSFVACRSPTQITFVVTTDVPCDQHGGTVFSIGRLADVDDRPVTSASSQCIDGRVGSVVAVPSSDVGEEVAVRIVLGIGKTGDKCIDDKLVGGCIMARRALRYVPHEPLVVNVLMRNKCRDIVCPAGTTCSDGDCVDATIHDPGGCVGAGCGEDALGEASDGTSDGPTEGATDGETPGGKRVFVTSNGFNAGLGGASGADAKCQSAADAVSLGGTFRAWISTPTSSPSTRFTRSGPYVLLDGTLVASDWADLTKGTLRHPIDMTETRGKPKTGSYCTTGVPGAWTGTTTKGEKDTYDSCLGFTSGALTLTTQVVYGLPSSTGGAWTVGTCLNGGVNYCNRLASLYCFEQ